MYSSHSGAGGGPNAGQAHSAANSGGHGPPSLHQGHPHQQQAQTQGHFAQSHPHPPPHPSMHPHHQHAMGHAVGPAPGPSPPASSLGHGYHGQGQGLQGQSQSQASYSHQLQQQQQQHQIPHHLAAAMATGSGSSAGPASSANSAHHNHHHQQHQQQQQHPFFLQQPPSSHGHNQFLGFPSSMSAPGHHQMGQGISSTGSPAPSLTGSDSGMMHVTSTSAAAATAASSQQGLSTAHLHHHHASSASPIPQGQLASSGVTSTSSTPPPLPSIPTTATSSTTTAVTSSSSAAAPAPSLPPPTAATVYLALPFPRAPGGSGRALSAANVTPTPTPTGAPNAGSMLLLDEYRDVCDATSRATGSSVSLMLPHGLSGSPGLGPGSPPLTGGGSGQSSPLIVHQQRAQSATSPTVTNTPGPGSVHPPEPYTAAIRAPSMDAALRARAQLLAINPAKTSAIVRVNRHLLLTESGEMRAAIRQDVASIQGATATQITVLGEVPSMLRPPPGIPAENTAVEISGAREAVYAARIQLLVALDAHAGLHVDGSLDLDPKCHYVVAGRKAADLHHIMRTTNTNIYLPSPFAAHAQVPYTSPVGWENQLRPGQGRIFITGEQGRVVQAREMMLRAASAKKFMSRPLTVLPRKLDWMLTHRKDLVLRFMYDNGTFIAFPPLGSGQTLVTVYGDNTVAINRTLESVARLACDFYTAELRLLPAPSMMLPAGYRSPIVAPGAFAPAAYGPTGPSSGSATSPSAATGPVPGGGAAAAGMAMAPPLSPQAAAAFAAVLAQAAQAFETEIVLTSDGVVEMYGSDLGVAESFKAAARTEWLDIRHKEFISGKKNGKINKIIKASDASVVFDDWNEINMDELPAEISFHVPEVHHKRIIGVGGKNIQRIMKKFGVFVKFANADEHAAQGGYFDNDDNVIARTPSKNANNLVPLKAAILESAVALATMEPLHYLTSVPIRHHRWLASTVPGIEAAAVVTIRMPNRETGNDEVMITGHEPNVHLALNLVAECTPEVYMVPVVKRTPAFLAAIRAQSWRDLVVEPAKHQFDQQVGSPTSASDATSPKPSSSGQRKSPTPPSTSTSTAHDDLPPSGAFFEHNVADAFQFPPPPPSMPEAAAALADEQQQQQHMMQQQYSPPMYAPHAAGLAQPYQQQQQPPFAGGGSPFMHQQQLPMPPPGPQNMHPHPLPAPHLHAPLQRSGSAPLVDSAFRHFNSKLFSAVSMADTLSGGVAGPSPGPVAFNNTGGSGGGGAMTSRALGFPPSTPSLRDIFDNPGAGSSSSAAAANMYHSGTMSPLRRAASELTPAEAYAQMISPTTAAELPFLVPDPWSAAGFHQHQQQQAAMYGRHPNAGGHGGSPPLPPTGGEMDAYGSMQQQQPHQQQQQSSGILAPRGIFELGSLMDSLPQGGGRSPPTAPARPSAKSPSPLQVIVNQDVLATSPPTPLSLTTSAAAGPASASLPPTPFTPGPTSPGMAPTDLSPAQVQEVLTSANPIGTLCRALRLDEKYEAMLREQEIDLDVLLSMTDAELRELGVVAFGPRKKLVAAIQELVRAVQHRG
ncbi:hypothetical protein BCR44DRAFT_1499475 [Catenaria anguillulae PL171]|uniref:SAM domain-containing protein n=1 Tax=Catenaria anguillulae PL171 TaxID=765915 RepID=A0A1Y2HLY5_9FUNG|nr:hypothetical protein BCR44DRAFT_1499475 [Catenaria anguillulae PL171]